MNIYLYADYCEYYHSGYLYVITYNDICLVVFLGMHSYFLWAAQSFFLSSISGVGTHYMLAAALILILIHFFIYFLKYIYIFCHIPKFWDCDTTIAGKSFALVRHCLLY